MSQSDVGENFPIFEDIESNGTPELFSFKLGSMPRIFSDVPVYQKDNFFGPRLRRTSAESISTLLEKQIFEGSGEERYFIDNENRVVTRFLLNRGPANILFERISEKSLAKLISKYQKKDLYFPKVFCEFEEIKESEIFALSKFLSCANKIDMFVMSKESILRKCLFPILKTIEDLVLNSVSFSNGPLMAIPVYKYPLLVDVSLKNCFLHPLNSFRKFMKSLSFCTTLKKLLVSHKLIKGFDIKAKTFDRDMSNVHNIFKLYNLNFRNVSLEIRCAHLLPQENQVALFASRLTTGNIFEEWNVVTLSFKVSYSIFSTKKSKFTIPMGRIVPRPSAGGMITIRNRIPI